MRIHRATALVAGLLALLPLLSCTGVGTTGVLAPAGAGRLTVVMHDQPVPGLTEADVTISGARAHQVGGDWIELSGTFPMEVDLLTLADGRTITLSSGALPPGDYDALEVTITAVHLVTVEGAELSREFPVPVKIAVPVEFTVVEGQETVITLDFPVDASFTIVGTNFQFHPTIEVERVEIRR